MEKKIVVHDIKNILERLKVMCELLSTENFETFSKDEILKDLENDLDKLKINFQQLY